MSSIISIIQEGVSKAMEALYQQSLPPDQIQVMNATRREFGGDFTIVVFPFTKYVKKKPDEIAQEIGAFLVEQVPEISEFNAVKGFLNLSVASTFWSHFLTEEAGKAGFGQFPPNGHKVMVEFCSPNTNKPLHLGHVRNILLGWSCSRILEAAGYEVMRVQVVNDRGIAVCKSMVAWMEYGNGATPESTGIKGDHFVGDFYVEFAKRQFAEYQAWQASEAGQRVFREKAKEGQSAEAFFKEFVNPYFNEYSELGKKATDMLLRWEDGDPETVALWKMMNGWVYQGFDETFKALGVSFDKLYYESETYLLGKDMVEKGLAEGVFYKKEDGSVWVDLTDAGMDPKIVIRSNGTSV